MAAADIPLKQTRPRPKMQRQVTLMTGVMLEPRGFRRKWKEQVLSYESDEPLYVQRVPAVCKKLEGGVIIDLGLTDVRD